MSEFKALEKNILKNEVKKLNDKENHIIAKAKEIEKELATLKHEKVDLVVNIYREQLVADRENEIKLYIKEREDQFIKDLTNLTKEKDKKMVTVDKLYKNVEEQIITYQMLLVDLKEKKEELDTSYLAAKEYLRINKTKLIDEFNQKLDRKLDEKVQEFKNQISAKEL